ncbi:hypothetical protein B0H15DRAFT_786889 [Mycena belliarum]|uniref:Uncharacterized protein n=1 Tax=Mycena belliarum TaxID=1033014 RepID=A0AAD6TWR7_9AGAR|nr:hypothetical protein B0H15DRAFT_786889 [Mycena belliae]
MLHLDTSHAPAPAPQREQDLASASSTSLSGSPSPSSATVLLPRVKEAEDDEDDIGLARPAPAWSLRAAHAPALGLRSNTLPGAFPEPVSPPAPSAAALPGSSSSATSSSANGQKDGEKGANGATSTALEPKAKTPGLKRRSPLDAALAMQLRPGLGAGADGAWLVRFLMSFFGWFAVLVAGGQEFN